MRDRKLLHDRIEDTVFDEYRSEGIYIIESGYILICAGISTLIWPQAWWAQLVTVIVLCVPLIFLPKLRKRKILYPRLGFAQTAFRPSARRVARTGRTMMLWGGFLFVLFMFAFLFAWKLPYRLGLSSHVPIGKEEEWSPFVGESACIFLGGLLASLNLDLKGKGFWIIAIIALGTVFVVGYFHWHFSWVYLFIGILLSVTGIVRLRRFLRENPRLEETDAS